MELFKLFGTIAIQNADANEQIDDTTDRAKESENQISGAFKKIGTAVATYFAADKIKDFGLNCINAAADANAASSQFSQVFGDMESQAKKSLTGIADNTGIQVNRMKGSYTQIAAFAKTTGMDTSNALGLADRAMVAVADSAAFYDRSLEETTESLQSFLKGNYENDSALGLSCTEVTRNEAANRLYGKSFQDLSEAQKQLTLLQMVEDANKASGALGQAARESDTWTNQTGNLKQAWSDFQAVLGQNVLPLAVEIVKKMASAVQSVSDKVPAMIDWFNQYKGVIMAVAAVIGILTTAIGIQNAVQAIKSAMNTAEVSSLGALIAAKWADVAATAAMLAPYIAIVAAISALAAGVIYCYNHFETFRNIVNGVAEWIRTNVTAAFEFLRPYIEAIITAVGELVSAIGDRLMQAFQWIVDKITEVYNSSSPIVQAIKTLFTTHFENIKVVIQTVFEVIKTVVSTVMTVIQQIIQTITAAIKGDWSGVWNGIKSIFSTIWDAIKSIVTTVLNAIKTIISNVLNVAKSIVSNILNSIKSVFSNIWNSIKSTVSNVINGIKSTISSGLNAAKSVVSRVLESIKSKFSSIFESAKNIVKSAIDKIKSFFNFDWSLPKLKLPHFEISGKFSLDPPSVPKFGIEWYKKAMDDGMIMNKPTVFGVNPSTGKFLAGGEAGSETVVGTESLMNMIQNAVRTNSSDSKLIEMLGILLDWLIGGGYKDMLIDVLVNHVEFEFDNREIIRLVKKYAG
jgi:phage-related protein